ncbi:MAG TPA: O-antigen ligase family protein [Candidatus Dormibacteraeota bacterium]
MAAWPLARVERWFLRAGLFILPLAYWWDTYDHYVLPKLLVARTLVIGLLVLFILRALMTRSLEIKRTPLDLPWAAFLASALVSTILATNQNVAVFGIYSRYDGLMTIFSYAALFWLSIQAVSGPDEGRALLRVLMASGYVVAAIAMIQAVYDYQAQGQIVPAYGTLGNSNVLGAFLAMLCPLAYGELIEARTWGARILAVNALVVPAAALLLSFSRSSWLGAALAFVVIFAGERRAASRIAIVGTALVLVFALAVPGLTKVGGNGLERALEARARSVLDLSSWQASRLHIWHDSVTLIGSRPVFGYGPDNVGLVFPLFQTGNWAPLPGGLAQPIDKAHAETLQVAATQGLVGLAAYAFMIVAFIRAFWRGRRNWMALPTFAGWVGYQVTLQLNFSAPPAAMPFWIFAAAAVEIWTQPRRIVSLRLLHWRLAIGAGTVMIALLVALGTAWIVLPYAADARLLSAVRADFSGHPDQATPLAMQARDLWPRESVYAVEVGNLAFERGDWAAARSAYLEASQLGTYNPAVYRNLALSDQHLGRLGEAHAAARKAVELDRFDPANRALLAQFEPPGP